MPKNEIIPVNPFSSLSTFADFKPPTQESLLATGEYAKAKAENLEILLPYPDAQPLAVTIDDEPFETTAGALRAELALMGTPGQERAGGWPYRISVLSEEPEKFMKQERADLERSRDQYLAKLEPYEDDQLVWVVYPNEGAHATQTTAGSLRNMLATFDRSTAEALSHQGGFSIVSTDPIFDAAAYEKENDEAFAEMVQGTIDRVNVTGQLKDAMIHRLEAFRPDERLQVQFRGEEPKVFTRDMLISLIQSMSSYELEKDGIPTVTAENKGKRLGE